MGANRISTIKVKMAKMAPATKGSLKCFNRRV